MPSYQPIRSAVDLPAIGAGQELTTRDLKKDWRDTKGIHKAKDVAAFANHLGGTILIGASETNGRVGAYHPLSEEVANAGKTAFSQAVRDFCSPKPVFEPVVLPTEGGFVLAVNVEPEIGSVVGVTVAGDKARTGLGEDSFLFPVRAGIDSVYIPPEKLPMFIDARYRRLLILLNRIPPLTDVYAIIPAAGMRWSKRRFLEIDGERNVIVFDDGVTTRKKHVALDLLQSVYQSEGGQWRLVLTPQAHYSMDHD